jgi:hypothetical protein
MEWQVNTTAGQNAFEYDIARSLAYVRIKPREAASA